jgi:hypothetical protein
MLKVHVVMMVAVMLCVVKTVQTVLIGMDIAAILVTIV